MEDVDLITQDQTVRKEFALLIRGVLAARPLEGAVAQFHTVKVATRVTFAQVITNEQNVQAISSFYSGIALILEVTRIERLLRVRIALTQ